MSTLAGFDFMVEISASALLPMVQSAVTLMGRALITPFELDFPFSTGTARMLVSKLGLTCKAADDTVTLSFTFDHSSVIQNDGTALMGLDGTLAVTAKVSLEPSAGGSQAIGLKLLDAKLSFGPGLADAVASGLANDFHSALFSYIASLPVQTIPVGFTVSPGADGSISPLQFSSLEIHCLSNSIALFGDFSAAAANGNFQTLTGSLLTPGHNVALAISAGAFHSQIFCKRLATALGTSVDQLPTSCGNQGSFQTQGVSIDSFQETFRDGEVDIDASFSASGTCYSATGSVHGSFAATVQGTTLIPTITIDDPNVDLQVGFLCELALAIIDPAVAAFVFLAQNTVNQVISSVGGDVLQNALDGIGGRNLPGTSAISGASFDTIVFNPEGMILNGILSVPPAIAAPATLSLAGQVTGAHDSGTPVTINAFGTDYTATEYIQNETAAYALQSYLLAWPYKKIEWSISSGGQEVQLSGAVSPQVLTVQATQYTHDLTGPPLITKVPGGFVTSDSTIVSSTVTTAATIAFKISGEGITLTNSPSDGNYTFKLKATVTDANGVVRTSSVTITMTGDLLVYPDNYYKDLQNSLKKYKELTMGPQSPPSAEEMLTFTMDLVTQPDAAAAQFIIELPVLFGSSYRAAISPERITGAANDSARSRGLAAAASSARSAFLKQTLTYETHLRQAVDQNIPGAREALDLYTHPERLLKA